MTTVALVGPLEQRLVVATTVGELKGIAAESEALRLYAKRERKSLAVQNKVALVGILAAHRAGVLLLQLERSPGARRDLQPPAGLARGCSPYEQALRQSGIAGRTARRWQRWGYTLEEIALRRAYKVACTEGEEFTRAGVDDLASWAVYNAAQMCNAPGRLWWNRRTVFGRRRSVGPPYRVCYDTLLRWGSRARRLEFLGLVRRLSGHEDVETVVLRLLRTEVARLREGAGGA